MSRQRRYSQSIQDFWDLSARILEFSNRGVLRVEFQEEVARMILDFSGCDEVELWVREHGKYFRSIVTRVPPDSVHFEILPYLLDEKGEILREGPELPLWVDLGHRVLKGSRGFPPAWISPGGALRIPNWARASRKERSSLGDPTFPYLSLAFIPIRADAQNFGLLILKSLAEAPFSKEGMRRYENLGLCLGTALKHRNAQVELRERVKELSCLYGIARLIAKPGISWEEILQQTVELLPSAWLYPEIATARIIVDGRAFVAPGFREGLARQKADIVVDDLWRGTVEVFYLDKRPDLYEGPFLEEERKLIDAVARELGNLLRQKKIEEEQGRLQEQLRHADRLATIGQLAAGIAHEINEPLGNILGFAGLAKKCPDLPTGVQADLEKITTAALHAREIIRKMLLFARQMPPQKTLVNLNALVEEGLHFFEARCLKEGIQMIRSLDPDLPLIAADPAQMNQVLVNLVVNALQAMPKGGKLRIETFSQGEAVVLAVEDSGVGIPPEHLGKIFTPFFTTKEVGQGTGLGLPVVHGIVSSHGGRIQVESQPGRGTRLEIHLPRAKGGENSGKAENEIGHAARTNPGR